MKEYFENSCTHAYCLESESAAAKRHQLN